MTGPESVLITGASSGIGLATATRLLELGYHVVGISRRGIADGIDHPNFSALAVDLENLEQVAAELRKLLAERSFDSFVHAAGQGRFGSIEQFSIGQIESLMRVNLVSAMVICRGLVPEFRRRCKGRLVFIGSESALVAGRKGALYCASKFGLRGFCLSLREDCASDGVQVSLINPGMVRSPFFDGLDFAPGPEPENAIEASDVAAVVVQILQSGDNIVIDEVNLSPRVKSIDFSRKP